MATQDKKVTVFDIVKIMTTTERKWSDLTEDEQKATEPFMIIMILSMHPDLIDICNEFQRYAISTQLTPREVYMFFNELLTKQSYYSPWIKNKKESSYNELLMGIFAKEYKCSLSQTEEYLDLLFNANKLEAVIKVVSKYGYSEAEVEAIILNKPLPKSKPKKVATTKKTKSK
jgi:hypothetical protein